MNEDLLPKIEALERAVEVRDAGAAATIWCELSDVEIYSGNEAYDRLHALEGSLSVVLFEGLAPAEFGQLVSEFDHHFNFDIWESLEDVADRVSAEALWEMKDYLGFPSPQCCPKLHATLAAADDEKISEQLIETIDRLATLETENGVSLSAHERTMSAFHFIRWNQDDEGLGDCVRLLAARSDGIARAACGRYLMELPWGADRQATLALLEGMSTSKGPANHAQFKDALASHRRPAVLRTWLWGAVGNYNLSECLLGAIGDLAGAGTDADRMTFIEYLDSALSQIAKHKAALDLGPVAAAAEKVDTADWSRVTRGCYGTMLQAQLVEANVARISTRLDRVAISVANAWEAVRLDHMGCVVPLVLMIGLGWLVGYGLDKLLGKPMQAPGLPVALFAAWIFWALGKVRTHFSGHETVGGKVRDGTVYFALLLGALVAAVLVRVG